jgi:hypothetical protein
MIKEDELKTKKDEFKRMWEEVVAQFKAPSRNYCGQTEENHKKHSLDSWSPDRDLKTGIPECEGGGEVHCTPSFQKTLILFDRMFRKRQKLLSILYDHSPPSSAEAKRLHGV